MLVAEVLGYKPDSVFEFGSGTGKHLTLLRDLAPNADLCGLDISFVNITHAHDKNSLQFLIKGDERLLCRLRNFDVVITCSVLCHIPDIEQIVSELRRICNKGLLIAETTDVKGEFYYPHDYEAYGFTDTGISWLSPANKANYKIYRYSVG